MRTTKADFALFCKECQRWIDKFGLKQWDVIFDHEPDNEDFCGSCVADHNAHFAYITLGYLSDDDPRPKTELIKTTALHEVLELLIQEYRRLMLDREYTSGEEERLRHCLIQTLINVIR